MRAAVLDDESIVAVGKLDAPRRALAPFFRYMMSPALG
jgi:hypothetical protein